MYRVILAAVRYRYGGAVGNTGRRDGITSILLYVYTMIYLPTLLLRNFYVVFNFLLI